MKRFDVWLVNLDPTVGSEIKKTRPGVIVSPDELNAHLETFVVVPLTTGRAYPFRIATQVQGKKGVAAIDQVRTVDKRRLVSNSRWQAPPRRCESDFSQSCPRRQISGSDRQPSQ